jgi:hypothetical protein
MKNIDVEIDGADILGIFIVFMISLTLICAMLVRNEIDIEKEKTKQLEIQLQMEQKQEV